MDVQAIHKREGLITTRTYLSEVIEENCLDACLTLYDKNIRTVSANGNIQYAISNLVVGDPIRSSLFIHIDYDSLDEKNKQIAEQLYQEHLVDISTTDTYGGICKKVIIMEKNNNQPGQRPSFNSSNFIKKCKDVADAFVYQDVLFGRYTPDEMLQSIIAIQKITDSTEILNFLLKSNLVNSNMTPNIEGILTYVQHIELPVFINDINTGGYQTIYLGKIYDEKTNAFWVNQELLEKHRTYIGSLGIDEEPENKTQKL